MSDIKTYEVLNGSATLTVDGKKSVLTIKPGFLPLRAINPVVTALDNHGIKIASQAASAAKANKEI